MIDWIKNRLPFGLGGTPTNGARMVKKRSSARPSARNNDLDRRERHARKNAAHVSGVPEVSPKYMLTDKTLVIKDEHGKRVTVHRIKALRDFSTPEVTVKWCGRHIHIPSREVKKGQLGGYIQFCENLSQRDACWVDDDAVVYGKNTRVFMDALVCEDAIVGSADGLIEIFGKSIVAGRTKVYGYTAISDSIIRGNACVRGDAEYKVEKSYEDPANRPKHEASILIVRSMICDETEVAQGVHVAEGSVLAGKTKANGRARIRTSLIVDASVGESAEIVASELLGNGVKVAGEAKAKSSKLSGSVTVTERSVIEHCTLEGANGHITVSLGSERLWPWSKETRPEGIDSIPLPWEELTIKNAYIVTAGNDVMIS